MYTKIQNLSYVINESIEENKGSRKYKQKPMKTEKDTKEHQGNKEKTSTNRNKMKRTGEKKKETCEETK